MKKNIVFYCHNFGGLGHTRRLFLIIKEILDNFGDFYNVIFLNSGEIQDFIFKEINGIKIINLPNYKFENYNIIDGEKILIYRKSILNRLFLIGNMEKLIVEHYPFGRNFLDEEIRFLIGNYKKYNKKGVVLSSVRDIFDINSLNKKNLELFDRFLIHSDKNIVNYNNIFSEDIEKKIIYTGYIVENLINEEKEEDYILLNLGGGQDGIEFVIDFLNLFKKVNSKFKVFINLGLSYNNENLSKIYQVGINNIEIKDYFNDFINLKKKAKIVVSMGGYNNFIENIYYNKISLIYPRKTDNEQKNRLDIFKSKFNNIYNAKDITSSDLKKILLSKKNNFKNNINFNGVYFSASFLVNFKKYKYIKIRLTNVCNAKCDMCGVIKRKIQYNEIEKLKKSIIDFYKIGGEVVNFTGGEPTIYKGFWELLKLSKSLCLITSVSTNGSTLGDDFINKLYYNGIRLIDYIDISIDGLYEKQDIRRGYKGLFKIIEDNINKLIDKNIFIHINITIRKDNILEMKEIFEYFKKVGVHSVSFGMITSAPINDTTKLIPKKIDLEKFYFHDKKYILSNSGNIKIVISPDYIGGNFNEFMDSIHSKNTFHKNIGNNCNFIKTKKELRINEGGDISPCCEIDDFEEGLGNINKIDLLDVICSKNYEDFLNKRFPNISKACLNCKIEI